MEEDQLSDDEYLEFDDADEEDDEDNWHGRPSPLDVKDDRIVYRVMEEKCKTCVFRPADECALNQDPNFLKGFLGRALKDENFIVCHTSLVEGARHEPTAVCKGFFDGYKEKSVALRTAEQFGIEFYYVNYDSSKESGK